jgi:hypothetical protein
MDRDGRVPIMWLGLDRHILTFPVKRGEQVNVVGFVREWVSPVLLDRCRTGFIRWRLAAQNLTGMLYRRVSYRSPFSGKAQA